MTDIRDEALEEEWKEESKQYAREYIERMSEYDAIEALWSVESWIDELEEPPTEAEVEYECEQAVISIDDFSDTDQ